MPGRTAKFVSALFAGILAGIPLTTVSHGATPAADDCLSGPKDPAPRGSHWYYRIDHATKRHCWYLKGEKSSPGSVANSSPSAKPAAPDAEAPAQRSIADAHAELPAQTALEAQKPPAGPAPAAAVDTTTATPTAQPKGSAMATRWPEQSGTDSPTIAPPAVAAAAAPAAPDTALSAAPAPVALAAADAPPENRPGSIQTLLLVIFGALALAGLIGSAVYRFGNLRWTGRRAIQIDRQAIWETANIDRRASLLDFEPVRIRRDDIPRELRTANDPDGRIQQMLARLARSAAN
jgi:hypothetical protein